MKALALHSVSIGGPPVGLKLRYGQGALSSFRSPWEAPHIGILTVVVRLKPSLALPTDKMEGPPASEAAAFLTLQRGMSEQFSPALRRSNVHEPA